MAEKETSNKSINDPLIDPYFIEIDQYCYTVSERVTPDPKYTANGKEYKKTIGHYSNFNSCLETIAKHKVNSKEHSTIKGYIKEFNEIKNQLKNLTQI